MVAGSERRRALRFAGVFAAAATAVWAVLLIVGDRTTTYLDIVAIFWFVYHSLNIGGEVLGWWIEGLHDPADYPPTSMPDWTWVLAGHSVASFVQGLAYACLWSVWRRSRARAAVYMLATALVSYKAFTAGVEHFNKVNCRGPGFDGDCDLGIYDGMMWAASAFGIAIALVVLVETVIRRHRTPVPSP